jgi:hypothetical protein
MIDTIQEWTMLLKNPFVKDISWLKRTKEYEREEQAANKMQKRGQTNLVKSPNHWVGK